VDKKALIGMIGIRRRVYEVLRRDRALSRGLPPFRQPVPSA